jgi:hypothetical protein
MSDYVNMKDVSINGVDFLRNHRVLKFIELLEIQINPNFDIKLFNQIAFGCSKISVKKISEANLLSIKSTSGRYGTTYLHKALILFVIGEKDPSVFLNLYSKQDVSFTFKSISESGHIYIISYGNNIFKIGKAKNVTKRLEGLIYQTGLDLSLIDSFYIENNLSKIEKLIHNQYKDSNLRAIELCKDKDWFDRNTELFYLTDEDVLNVTNFIKTLGHQSESIESKQNSQMVLF